MDRTGLPNPHFYDISGEKFESSTRKIIEALNSLWAIVSRRAKVGQSTSISSLTLLLTKTSNIISWVHDHINILSVLLRIVRLAILQLYPFYWYNTVKTFSISERNGPGWPGQDRAELLKTRIERSKYGPMLSAYKKNKISHNYHKITSY